MATNKNQHFVPRCYLRPFTGNGEGRSINVFNIDRAKLILGAPVKNQCSKDYFYGSNQYLENAIQAVEGAYSEQIKSLLGGAVAISQSASIVLRRFWLLQNMRTEAASVRAVELSTGLAEALDPDGRDFALTIKEAVQLAMHAYAESMTCIDDLNLCLIRNTSSRPFVTSDDPAILTNRWHFHRQLHLTRSFGLGSAGVIGMLPISEILLCVLYDAEFYDITAPNGFADISSDSDVELVNEHQFLNCHANIYTRTESEHFLLNQLNQAMSRRIYPSRETTYSVRDCEVEGGDLVRYKVVNSKPNEPHEALIHSRQLHASPRAWPSFLRWKYRGHFAPDDKSTRRGTSRW